MNIASTTTTLTDLGPNPSLVGGSVTFTAAVTGGLPTTAETILLEDASNGNASVGSGTLANGSTTITENNLSVGSHSIFAVYSGDANDSPSQSAMIVQDVQASTTTTLTDNGSNPALIGQAISFTAAVSGGSAINGESVLLEDGSNGNATVGSGTLSNSSVTFSATIGTTGTHNLFAVYSGDATHAGSQSSQVAQSVVGFTSYMGSLPAVENTAQFTVTWFGYAGTGWTITSYTIFVSDNFGRISGHRRTHARVGREHIAGDCNPFNLEIRDEQCHRLLDLLRPCPADGLAVHPVDARVGNVRNQGPELIAPLDVLFLSYRVGVLVTFLAFFPNEIQVSGDAEGIGQHRYQIPRNHRSRSDQQAVINPENLKHAHDCRHPWIHSRARPAFQHGDQVWHCRKCRPKACQKTNDLRPLKPWDE